MFILTALIKDVKERADWQNTQTGETFKVEVDLSGSVAA